MANQSSSDNDGVPSFDYNPATERQPFLFQLTQPIADLGIMLCQDFAGQTLTMKQIYENHHVNKPFIEKNYKKALTELEAEGSVAATPTANKRRKGTFGNDVLVTFPQKENE